MNAPSRLLTDSEIERYSRQLILEGVGEAGQERLRRARVLVVGAGALGSSVLTYLAAAGVGHLTVYDGDNVELSNLSRQPAHGEADAGRNKADSARSAALALNSTITVEAIPRRLEPGDARAAVGGFSVVCDATDDFASKFALNDACVREGVPLVHAAILAFGGQLTTIVPGGPCYRCLFGEPPDSADVPTCAQAGILGPVAAVVGGLQATEALKLVLGIGKPLSGRLLVYEGLEPSVREVAFKFDRKCTAHTGRRAA